MAVDNPAGLNRHRRRAVARWLQRATDLKAESLRIIHAIPDSPGPAAPFLLLIKIRLARGTPRRGLLLTQR